MSLTSDSDISLHFSTNINVHKENSGASWSFLCTHAGYIKIELQNSPHLSHCSKNAEQVHMVLTLNSFAQFRKNLFFFSGFFMEKSWTASAQFQCRIKIHGEIWFSSQPWYPQKLYQESVLNSDFIKNQFTAMKNTQHKQGIPFRLSCLNVITMKKKINVKHKLCLKDVWTKLN